MAVYSFSPFQEAADETLPERLELTWLLMTTAFMARRPTDDGPSILAAAREVEASLNGYMVENLNIDGATSAIAKTWGLAVTKIEQIIALAETIDENPWPT